MSASVPTSLRHNRDFRLFFASQSLSAFSGTSAGFAVSLLVFRQTHSAQMVGLCQTFAILGMIVGSLPGGVIADRCNRRTIITVSNAVMAVVTAVLAIIIFAGYSPLALLLILGTIESLILMPFEAARVTALPQIITDVQLPTALSAGAVRANIVLVLGPLLGGYLLDLSPSLPFWVNSATFLAAILCVLAMRNRLAAPRDTGHANHWLKSSQAGFRYLWEDRPLRRLTIFAASTSLINQVLYLSIIVRFSGHTHVVLSVGTVTAVVACGGLVGAALAPRLSRSLPSTLTLRLPNAISAFLVVSLAFSTSPIVITALQSAIAAISSVVTLFAAAAMLRSEEHIRGRVHSASEFISFSTATLSAFAAGALLDRIPQVWLFLLLGMLLLCLTPILPEGQGKGMICSAPIRREDDAAGLE